jgi:hypothetical protein
MTRDEIQTQFLSTRTQFRKNEIKLSELCARMAELTAKLSEFTSKVERVEKLHVGWSSSRRRIIRGRWHADKRQLDWPGCISSILLWDGRCVALGDPAPRVWFPAMNQRPPNSVNWSETMSERR